MKTRLLKLSPKAFCRATKACEEGAQFAANYSTMAEVWANCPRVDWLVWMLNAIDAPPDEKACRLYMVWCVRNTPLADGRTTGDLLTDERSRNALEVAERAANGQATADELSAARSAAESAAWSAVRSAVRSAAWSAAESAAWSAARSAAWSAQAAQFRKVVPNPFAS